MAWLGFAYGCYRASVAERCITASLHEAIDACESFGMYKYVYRKWGKLESVAGGAEGRDYWNIVCNKIIGSSVLGFGFISVGLQLRQGGKRAHAGSKQT
jgi:hypothetical protein